MTKEPKPRGLGRGLAALLGDDVQVAPPPPLPSSSAPAPETAPTTTPGGTGVTTIPITWLKASPFQPRTIFDPAHIAQLADSIKAHGLVQPLLVRPVPDAPNRYEIVAGERRWRAAQQAQLHDVPVVVRTLDDREVLEIALIENVQRADLTPIEEARAYRRLVDEFRHTQERLAEIIGKSRAHVANILRLLELPAAVQVHVEHGRLDMGHARALIGTPDPAFLADYIINKKLTTRRAEQLAADAKEARKAGWDGRGLPPAWTEAGRPEAAPGTRGANAPAAAAPATSRGKTAETRGLEKSIEEALGLKVSIDVTGPAEQAQLTIWMDNFDQMDEVVERLTRRR